MHSKRIIITGGGVTGLATAYHLIKSGVPGSSISILEAQAELGGLASTFNMEDIRLDRYYHFLCRPDHEYVKMLDDLGIGDSVIWRKSRMAFYHKGRVIPFCGPIDLLRFPEATMRSRLRYAFLIAAVRFSTNWRHLEHVTAREWLRRRVGENGYDAFWSELIRRKFGEHGDELSAAWIWARIRRNALSRRGLLHDYLGYVRGGTGVFLDALDEHLRGQGVKIRLNAPARAIVLDQHGAVAGVRYEGGESAADQVIHTAPLVTLPSLLPRTAPRDYHKKIKGIRNIGIVCTVLELKRPLTGIFWINVTDRSTPQTGIIEFTALSPEYHPQGRTVLYLPEYRSMSSSDRDSIEHDATVQSYLPLLSRINRAFSPSWITGSAVFSALHAQPICPVGFSSHVPDAATGIRGLWAIDHTHLLPDDRTIAGCIKLARDLARRIQRHN